MLRVKLRDLHHHINSTLRFQTCCNLLPATNGAVANIPGRCIVVRLRTNAFCVPLYEFGAVTERDPWMRSKSTMLGDSEQA